MAKLVQNILIFKSIRLFWTKIFIRQNICRFFSRVNLFGYSFVIFLCCRIGWDIHSSNIYGNKYIQIQIFICQKKMIFVTLCSLSAARTVWVSHSRTKILRQRTKRWLQWTKKWCQWTKQFQIWSWNFDRTSPFLVYPASGAGLLSFCWDSDYIRTWLTITELKLN